MVLSDLSISFPNLGIDIYDLPNKISIFGIDIAFYGIIIGLGMLAGMVIAFREARLTGQNTEDYMDLALYGIVFAIIGARLYYVIFQWDDYKGNLIEIFSIRKGGLAIYGGIIAAIITCIVVAKVKKKNFFQMADTGCLGVLLGQIIGRWGNFFNRECFGGDTNGLFAMKINTWDPAVGGVSVPDSVSYIDDMKQYIQVQPTFLYESALNFLLLVLIMIFRKKKKYHGEIFLWYMCGYGIIRVFVEEMRTDQLILGNTGIAVSQLLAGVLAVGCGAIIIYNRIRKHGCQSVWRVEAEVEKTSNEKEATVKENTLEEEKESIDEESSSNKNEENEN